MVTVRRSITTSSGVTNLMPGGFVNQDRWVDGWGESILVLHGVAKLGWTPGLAKGLRIPFLRQQLKLGKELIKLLPYTLGGVCL